jgi:hypothetical protein
MKKKNAQTQSLLPQKWGLAIWSRECFGPQLGPTPRLHLHLPRKNGKRFFGISFRSTISRLISTYTKKKLQKPIISLPNMEVQNLKKNSPSVCVDVGLPSTIPFAKNKMVRAF